MFFFVLRRVLSSIPLVLLVLVGLFFLVRLMPGDPASFYISPDMKADQVEAIRAKFGLDDPVMVQFGKSMWAYLQGDFGTSFHQNTHVTGLLLDALPNTLLLSTVSLVLIFVLGTIMGVISAVKQYSLLDQGITFGSLFLYSMPSFWLGLMLVMGTAALVANGTIDWPISGMVGDTIRMKEAAIQEALMFDEVPTVTIGVFERLLDTAKHLVLPAIALGVAPSAGIARYARSSMLEVIRMDYIRTARAKGVPSRRVIFRHALKNALIPMITLLGLYLPFLISGAVLVETIFSWPGMGRLLVGSINTRDYPVVIGAGIWLSTMVVFGNLAADTLYGIVDPRISYD